MPLQGWAVDLDSVQLSAGGVSEDCQVNIRPRITHVGVHRKVSHVLPSIMVCVFVHASQFTLFLVCVTSRTANCAKLLVLRMVNLITLFNLPRVLSKSCNGATLEACRSVPHTARMTSNAQVQQHNPTSTSMGGHFTLLSSRFHAASGWAPRSFFERKAVEGCVFYRFRVGCLVLLVNACTCWGGGGSR